MSMGVRFPPAPLKFMPYNNRKKFIRSYTFIRNNKQDFAISMSDSKCIRDFIAESLVVFFEWVKNGS